MAEADKKEAAKDGAEAAAPPSKMKALLPYMVGGVVSVGLGLTAAIVTAPAPVEPEVIVEKEEPPPTPLDTFLPPKKIALPQLIANLADTGQAVSGKFVLILEIRAKDVDTENLVVAACAKGGDFAAAIRDSLITLMSGKQSTELKTPRGKELLKLEILDQLKPILFADPANGAITGLFFDDFLVQ
ncbi:MAG: flagellar basal body-associated FliL family protein [Planctomycetes bacterium]|nr:flagellar basal body-associated FliL family protein [Planctomycetota bacterium]